MTKMKGTNFTVVLLSVVFISVIAFSIAISVFGEGIKRQKIILEEVRLLNAKDTFDLTKKSLIENWRLGTLNAIFRVTDNSMGCHAGRTRSGDDTHDGYWFYTRPLPKTMADLWDSIIPVGEKHTPEFVDTDTGPVTLNPRVCIPTENDILADLKKEFNIFKNVPFNLANPSDLKINEFNMQIDGVASDIQLEDKLVKNAVDYNVKISSDNIFNCKKNKICIDTKEKSNIELGNNLGNIRFGGESFVKGLLTYTRFFEDYNFKRYVEIGAPDGLSADNRDGYSSKIKNDISVTASLINAIDSGIVYNLDIDKKYFASSNQYPVLESGKGLLLRYDLTLEFLDGEKYVLKEGEFSKEPIKTKIKAQDWVPIIDCDKTPNSLYIWNFNEVNIACVNKYIWGCNAEESGLGALQIWRCNDPGGFGVYESEEECRKNCHPDYDCEKLGTRNRVSGEIIGIDAAVGCLQCKDDGFVTINAGDPACQSSIVITPIEPRIIIVDIDFDNRYFSSSKLLGEKTLTAYYSKKDRKPSLWLAVCEDEKCSSISKKVVDDQGDVGEYPSIAIRNGLPVISYYDATNQDLKLAVCNDISCSLSTVSIIEDKGNVGAYSSLAVDSNFMIIAYQADDGVTDKINMTLCMDERCASKETRVVSEIGDDPRFPSIAIGKDGPMIAYYDKSNGDLKFVACRDRACTSKSVVTIDSVGDVGILPSIARGKDDFARISYYDKGNTDLKFVQCKNVVCDSNFISTVDSAGDVGTYSSLVVGEDGFSKISYYDATNKDLKFARCLNDDCSLSEINVVDKDGNVGRFTSLNIKDNIPRITYYNDDSPIGLKYALCKNPDCT